MNKTNSGRFITKYSKNILIEMSNTIHNNKYDYSLVKYDGIGINKVEIICPFHGSFHQEFSSHAVGMECQKCGFKTAHKTKMKKYKKTFFVEAKQIHNNKYDYSKSVIIKATEPIIVICSKHGEFKSIPCRHIKQKKGCPKCGKEAAAKERKEKTFEKYKEQIKNDFLMLEEYKGAVTKIKHQCKKCDNIWSVTPNNIKQGKGCPVCSANKTAYETYKDVPTWLYYIFIPSKNLYKTGVSMDRNGGTKGRYKYEPFDIEIIQQELFEDGYKAWKLEQEIIQSNKDKAWIPSEDDKFGGWTECFVEDIQEKCLLTKENK